MSTHGLELGALDLASTSPSADGYTLSVLSDGATFGSAQAAVREIVSMLADGNLVTYDRSGNRVVEFDVLIEAPDGLALAAGEVALRRELYRSNTVTWTPPSDFAPPSVYEVLASEMSAKFDDLDELRGRRVFHVVLTCYPWARSADKTLTPALVPPPATVTSAVVDTCDSVTGWEIIAGSATNTGLSTGGGRIGTRRTGPRASPSVVVFRRTGTIATSATPYVYVDWEAIQEIIPGTFSNAVQTSIAANQAGQPAMEKVAEQALTPTKRRTWFKSNVATVTTLDVGLTMTDADASAGSRVPWTVDLFIYEVGRTDAATASQREVTRILQPGGSVLAEGDVFMEHATAGLGQVVIYSGAAGRGYDPSLRRWKVAGATTSPDVSLISGGYNALAPTCGFAIPANSIPRGSVHLWARLQRSTAATVRINWAAYSTMASFLSPLGPSMSGATDVAFPTAGEWKMVSLGRFVSPPTDIGSSGFLRVDIAGDSATVIDQGWLFAMDDAALTIVDCGGGTAALGSSANRLQISAPSATYPNGRLLVGYAADWSDSHAASDSLVICDTGSHHFDPTGASVFTASSGTASASVSFQHYRRWHSNAGS